MTINCCGCGYQFVYDDAEICVDPWPHVDCPLCGTWVPLF